MVIIPVYNIIILPNTKIYLQMDKLDGINEKELKEGSRILFLISKTEEKPSLINMDNFYQIGCMGVLKEINTNGFLIVETKERVNIEDIHYEKKHIQFGLSKREEIKDLDHDEEKIKLSKLKSSLNKFVSKYQWGTFLKNLILEWRSISEVICAISMWLTISNKERYELLEEDSTEKRTKKIENIIY